MWNEIKKTRDDKRTRKEVWDDLETCKDIEEEKEQRFDPCFKHLRLIRQMGKDVPYFYTWVVGRDGTGTGDRPVRSGPVPFRISDRPVCRSTGQ
jgi:hypothetical protein